VLMVWRPTRAQIPMDTILKCTCIFIRQDRNDEDPIPLLTPVEDDVASTLQPIAEARGSVESVEGVKRSEEEGVDVGDTPEFPLRNADGQHGWLVGVGRTNRLRH